MGTRKEDVTAPFAKEKEYMEFRIQEGIEKNRKDLMTICVQGENGKPLPGAKVEVTQQRHQFKFGANLFLLDEMESEEKNTRYREIFPEVFNHATLPIYWNGLEPEQGHPRFVKDSPKVYRRPALDLCLEYCEQNGILPKAHCLVYDTFTPDWVPDDVFESKRLHRKRLAQLAERYKERIPHWEVINETLIPYQPLRNRPIFKEPDYVDWALKMAERYFPDNHLLINEGTEWVFGNSFLNDRTGYYMLIERLLDKNVRVDGIGLQFHMFYQQQNELAAARRLYDPRRQYEAMDTYGRFRKPLQITEVTIPAYSEKAEDEETQAEIARNLYRMWFSHEWVESIVWWNLVDGYAYQPAGRSEANENIYFGGLLRHDLSEKPVWHVIKDLVNREWRTNASLVTGKDGKVSQRGFFGEYEIRVTAEGKQVTKKLTLNNRDAKREYVIEI